MDDSYIVHIMMVYYVYSLVTLKDLLQPLVVQIPLVAILQIQVNMIFIAKLMDVDLLHQHIMS